MHANISVQCAARLESTCATFSYSLDCLRQTNGRCADSEYDGNGKIKLDEGTYEYNGNIEISNAFVMIGGSGFDKTEFIHQGNIYCVSTLSYLLVSNLTYIARNASFIVAENGGHLLFNHVHFGKHELLKFVVSNNAEIRFTDCVFSNNDIAWNIEDRSTASFEDCSFLNLQSNSDELDALISVESSTVAITDCVFENITNFESILKINNYSSASMTDSVFIGNNVSHIWNSFGSEGVILNTTNDCNTTCILHLNGDLKIDTASAADNTLEFGWMTGSESLTSAPITFYAFDFEPKTIFDDVEFINFDADDGKIIFMPCLEFDSEAVDNTIFDTLSEHFNATHVFNESAQFFDKNLTCGNSSICYIRCEENALTCPVSNFVSIAASRTLFGCLSKSACYDSTIQVNESQIVSILCNWQDACKDAGITVADVLYFTLECVQPQSCLQMTVNIANTTTATIHCYGQNACDGMQVYSDTNVVQINMHSHSNDVVINIPSEYSPLALNGDPKNAYILLNASTFNGSLEHEARAIFGGQMPAEGIIYSFAEQSKVDCDIRYSFSPSSEIVTQLQYLDDSMQCFPPIHISDFADYDCVGTKSPTVDPTEDPTSFVLFLFDFFTH